MPSITTSPPSFYDEDFDLGSNDTTFAPFPISPSNKIITCEQHIISSLILLDFVVIGAYFFGIYLFVRGETEYLFGLASHVSLSLSSPLFLPPSLLPFVFFFLLFPHSLYHPLLSPPNSLLPTPSFLLPPSLLPLSLHHFFLCPSLLFLSHFSVTSFSSLL